MTAPHESTALAAVGEWLDVEWSASQIERIHRYEAWLGDEALPAGGIGPGEAPRLFDRHIADSLAFLRLVDDGTHSLVDVGSGVGLPGIPIAIARPDLAVTLLDRSKKRNRLARRAIRILGLDNVSVLDADAHRPRREHAPNTYDAVVFRASLPIADAVGAYNQLAEQGGTGIFAWSRRKDPKSPPEPPTGTIFTLTSEGVGVLDSPAWFLRMERSP